MGISRGCAWLTWLALGCGAGLLAAVSTARGYVALGAAC